MSECKCDLRTKLVGDGCEVCSPALALECAKETIADLEAKLAASEAEVEALGNRLDEKWYGASAAATAEINRLNAACEQMREALQIYVHAHQSGNSVPPHIESAAVAALATDAGKGWVSTEGAAVGNVSDDCLGRRTWLDGGGPDLPSEWCGSEVYIIKKEQTP